MSPKMYNSTYLLTNKKTKELLVKGTIKEVVEYMLQKIEEAFEYTKKNLEKKIEIALHNGTFLFRKYEIAKDEPVKHIAPNKYSVPESYLSVVSLKNIEMLGQLRILQNKKRMFPNDIAIIKAQEQCIENLKRIDCGEFIIKWNDKAQHYEKA